MSAPTGLILGRPPQTDTELYYAVQALWGVTVPRTPVCPDHVTPFQAFSDAYFGRNGLDPDGLADIALWHGSRGLSGKSYMLAVLGLTKAVMLGSDVNLLGGSFEQSKNIHIHMRNSWDRPNAPRYMLTHDGAMEVKLSNKAVIRPLTASQRTVRGPHPPFLLLDEIDEMDLEILDAALGQPLPQKNWLGRIVEPYTVMCSTWQNPEGTFTEIMRRAEDKGIPIYQWCVGAGSGVLTERGEVPIEQVTDADRVLTRQGWRQVQHVTFMGYKPTVELQVGDRTLRCTPDHRIATVAGWRTAGALAAEAIAAVGPDVGIGRGELVATSAVGAARLVPPRARLVGPGRDQLQVFDVHAAAPSAQVISLLSVGDGADDFAPHPEVGAGAGPAGAVRFADPLDPVAATFGPRPVDAVRLEHGAILVPVYDIGVEGAHEFVVEGVVVHNCYKETSNPVDGWLSPETIASKRAMIPKAMWDAEYDLNEPAIGNRAFDTEAVDATFCLPLAPIAEKISKDFEEYTFERPEKHGHYIVAADWGKEQDYTVIMVGRLDVEPHRLVYFMKVNRRPYPQMIRWFNEAINRYGASAIHDGTGLGNVVADLVDIRARKFIMTGAKRSDMLSDYVSAIEQGRWAFPKIKSAYLEMKYARVADLYQTGKDYHLPDTVSAGALLNLLARRSASPATPVAVPRDNTRLSKLQAHFATPSDESERSATSREAPEPEMSFSV